MLEFRFGHKYTNELKDEIEIKLISIGHKTKTNIGQSSFISYIKKYVSVKTGNVNFAVSVWETGRGIRTLKRFYMNFVFPFRLFPFKYRGWRLLAQQGEFIPAIKQYRVEHSCGIKEAKEKIEKSRLYKQFKKKEEDRKHNLLKLSAPELLNSLKEVVRQYENVRAAEGYTTCQSESTKRAKMLIEMIEGTKN